MARLLGLLVLLAAATVVTHVGLTPEGERLPADVQRALEQRLGAWLRAWQSVLPGFGAGRLRGYGEGPLELDWSRAVPWDARDEEAVLRRRYLNAASPDGAWIVDPLGGFGLWREADGQLDGGRDLGGCVVLIDVRRGRALHIFNYCGIGRGYDHALWLDAHRFVVTGMEPADSHKATEAPVLVLVDLARRRRQWFSGPSVPNERMGRVYAHIHDDCAPEVARLLR